ncbi:MAG: alpha/beta hydrolase [Gammaproteobacteria bacterium]
MLKEKLHIPGIHHTVIPGLVGDLEVILEVPPNVNTSYFAILGHPHSLQGGTMQNKVVTTMARAFRELGIASLRFNFRGVGSSAGEYDAGLGEAEDMLDILQTLDCSKTSIFFAGFSFGSYVAYRALSQYPNGNPAGLITIAPSVHHYDYSFPLKANIPWLIVMGEEDEIVPMSAVKDFAQTHESVPILECFPDTGHFFHGKLLDLKAVLQKHINQWIKI